MGTVTSTTRKSELVRQDAIENGSLVYPSIEEKHLEKDDSKVATDDQDNVSFNDEICRPADPDPDEPEVALTIIPQEKLDSDDFPPEPDTREIGSNQIGITSEKRINKRMSKLRGDQLYQDKEFPPKIESIYFTQHRRDNNIKWISPQDMTEKPQLLVHGVSDDDVMQGNLGDCWFLASAAVIAQDAKLMGRVIPEQRPLYGPDYKGIVHFRFWRFGQWVDVYIDDLLPTKNGELVFAKCADPNEFWLPLMEKAYAKLHGTYEALEGGQAMDALVDLTSGLAIRYELKQRRGPDVYGQLLKAYKSPNSFITCSRKGTDNRRADSNGLIAGHAYSITCVRKVKYRGQQSQLLCIRNPWGGGSEWNGAWSDKDHRWKDIDPESRKSLGHSTQTDGEFWMGFEDFKTQFQEVTACAIKPDIDGDGDGNAKGHLLILHGEWKGPTAGGCRNDPRGFAKNPQYLLTLVTPDDPEEGDSTQQQQKCSIMIGLMQEHRRSQKHRGLKMLQIGYLIYKTDNPGERLTENILKQKPETVRSGTYVNFREVVSRFELDPGHYIIIPTTYDRFQDGTFMMRMYSEKPITVK